MFTNTNTNNQSNLIAPPVCFVCCQIATIEIFGFPQNRFWKEHKWIPCDSLMNNNKKKPVPLWDITHVNVRTQNFILTVYWTGAWIPMVSWKTEINYRDNRNQFKIVFFYLILMERRIKIADNSDDMLIANERFYTANCDVLRCKQTIRPQLRWSERDATCLDTSHLVWMTVIGNYRCVSVHGDVSMYVFRLPLYACVQEFFLYIQIICWKLQNFKWFNKHLSAIFLSHFTVYFHNYIDDFRDFLIVYWKLNKFQEWICLEFLQIWFFLLQFNCSYFEYDFFCLVNLIK